MQYGKVDLYAYFGVEKPNGALGVITYYIHDQSKEFCEGRTRPAMLVITGGAYQFLSDREKEPVALHFLARGFNTFTLDYSLAPVRYPAQLIEGAMAVAYIRENVEKFFIRPDFIAVAGFSAGGHLAAMTGTLFGETVVKNALKNKAVLCRPDALILGYPVINLCENAHFGSAQNLTGGDEKLKRELCLEKRVKEDSSPAFIWTTADDGTVPSENAIMYAEACKKAGVFFELHVFPRGVHGLSLATKETSYVGADEVLINPTVAAWTELAEKFLISRGFTIRHQGE